MDPVTRKEFLKLLFRKVCLPAIFEQAKVNRDEGKVLCPKMDDLVNKYCQILIDYPAPGGVK